MTDKYAHAYSNAKAWYETILDAYRSYKAMDDGERFQPGDDLNDLEERMCERALAVQVREPWHEPGADDVKPSEYHILLTIGGPALRIWGELDSYGQPDAAQLQLQDWGVPWREVWPCEVEEMDEARAALLWFAGLFYFGE